MSAEFIPLPAPVPNIAPLPPPPLQPLHAPAGPDDALSKLLKNPLVMAGGAIVAGLVLTRLFSVAPARRLLHEAIDEAMRKNTAAPAPLDDFLERGLARLKPHVTAWTKQLLDTFEHKVRG